MANERPKSPRRITTKKLLAASVGVATISYALIACDNKTSGPITSGNLMPPQPVDASAVTPPTASDANAPPDAATGALDVPLDASIRMITSGNLMPPEPRDAGLGKLGTGNRDGGKR